MLADRLSARFRHRRGALIFRIIDDILDRREHCRILDVGGTEAYWRLFDSELAARQGRIAITLSNINGEPPRQSGIFRHMTWDATDVKRLDGVDFVHSNSVIEHVGGWEGAQKFAANVRQQADAYYVQTPHFWFPVEPHFRSLFFHWLPEQMRYPKIMRRAYATYPKVDDFEQAMAFVREIYLMDRRQIRHLFPDGELVEERIAGLTKSLAMVKLRDPDTTRRLIRSTAGG